MEIKELEVDALVFHTNRYGHISMTKERRNEKVKFYATDRHRDFCNMCFEKNYPECRKNCQSDEWWRKRNSVTL